MDKHREREDTQKLIQTDKGSKFQKILAFFGPAYLVSVGYMDPGNWATDLEGGSRFGYSLIWILLMSNIMALLLQTLAARLGIVWGKDLAQSSRETYPKSINFILYILAEVAIAACDLAEVLGMAIGLQLLFGIPLVIGVSISFLDTFLLLYLERLGMRKMELFIIGLISLIGGCFLVEMIMAKPVMADVVRGFVPTIPNKQALYIGIGIIGATVMPHNLYLHSALVQTRKIQRNKESIRKALRYNFWDSTIALNLAFFVNAAILILAASVFNKNGMTGVATLKDAHRLLAPTMGSEWAPRLFAIALILSGQSSTVTGTLAGQIIMEGYLQLRISPALRRMITRLMAIIPAVLAIIYYGEQEAETLLVFSQVLLSMQLSFAVIPLIHFVSDKSRMGTFAIKWYVQVFAWVVTAIIVSLNGQLVYDSLTAWMTASQSTIVKTLIVFLGLGLMLLLIITVFYPLLKGRTAVSVEIHPPFEKIANAHLPDFKRIAVALDYSESDINAYKYAIKMGSPETHYTLIHIVESAPTQLLEDVNDLETRQDKARMGRYVELVRNAGRSVDYRIESGNRVKAIAGICEDTKADLLVVASHGHKGIKDFIFGETVDKLRHHVNIPVLIAPANQ